MLLTCSRPAKATIHTLSILLAQPSKHAIVWSSERCSRDYLNRASHTNTSLCNADDSPKLETWVQALHVTHRPTCWAALSALTAAGPKDTQSRRVADTANLLNDSKAQTLAQAQRAIKAFMVPTVTVKVRHCIHAVGCTYVTLLIMHLAVSTQPARLQTH